MKRSRLNDGSLTNESNYVNFHLHLLFFTNNDLNFLFYSQTLPLNLYEHQGIKICGLFFFFFTGEKSLQTMQFCLCSFSQVQLLPMKPGVYCYPHAINMQSSVVSCSCSLSDPDSHQRFI